MARPSGTKSIETPVKMWQYFQDYIKQTKTKPILVKDWVGKDGDMVKREKEKPLTYEGFQTYLCDLGIITDYSDYFENKDNRYKDYIQVCSRIKLTIRQDQIEGGMAGIYNPSITQRLNNLTEKVHNEVNHSGLPEWLTKPIA
jgi:hypothetical protein